MAFEALLLAKVVFLEHPPEFEAQDAASATTALVTAGTQYAIGLPTVVADQNSGWNAGTNTYTVQVPGTYAIAGGVAVTMPGSAGYFIAGVTVNGVLLGRSESETQMDLPVGDSYQQPIRSCQYPANVGDTIQLVATSGVASVNTVATSSLSLRWVHA